MANKKLDNGENNVENPLTQLNNGKQFKIHQFKLHFGAKCMKCGVHINHHTIAYFVGGKCHCTIDCAQNTQMSMETWVHPMYASK